jgi:sterol desaturase/sphingolipid hydroxylase (fatty acid hydroxylase superfamily)
LLRKGHPLGILVAGTAINVVLFVLEQRFPLVAGEDVVGDPEVPSDLGHTVLANGVLILVIVADGIEYWRHRLEHRVSWLWPIHALHHDVVRMHVLKSARNTFADMMLRSIVVYGPFAMLGAPRDVIVWHPLTLLVLGPIAHANVALPIPAFVHRLIVTPPGHRMHHARSRSHSDGNFAVVTPLWDLLFGTFNDPVACPPPPVGLDERLPTGFVRQALSPFLWRPV